MAACAKEDAEQGFVMNWARSNECRELEFLIHIPNGGKRGKAEAARLKRQGVKAGVSDLLLPVARKGFHGLWIEMKREKGGRLEPEQKEWLKAMDQQGYMVARCNGFEEAVTVLCWYLDLERPVTGPSFRSVSDIFAKTMEVIR